MKVDLVKECFFRDVDKAAEDKKTLEKHLADYFKDKDQPLESRWEVYRHAIKQKIITKIGQYVIHLPSLDKKRNFSFYDHAFLERYQTCYFTDLIETFEDQSRYSNDLENPYPVTQEEIPRIKEEILTQGLAGFVYDW